jgi:alpha-tubulin suppressor-like RCC1 family protein
VDFSAVAAGVSHSIALATDGTVFAWGRNNYGQLNVPTTLTEVVAVASGDHHCLALRGDGSVVAWGRNSAGQITLPGSLSNIVAIGAGSSHSLALQKDGILTVWGLNTSGQATVPPGLQNIVAVAGGGSHSLALRSDGSVTAWGSNSNGQTNVPPGLGSVVAIAAGGTHSLALRSDGTVIAWGNNGSGQTNVPSEVHGAVSIAAGTSHSLAALADGTVVAWGSNGTGQAAVPWWIGGGVGVAAGAAHSLALIGSGPPAIASLGPDRQVLAGSSLTVSAQVSGEPPFAPQWQFNGVDIPGATGLVLTRTNLQMSHAGTYRVRVANAWGETFSQEFTLEVLAFRIAAQPRSSTNLLRGTATFAVQLEGQGPFTQKWYFNGAPITGATQATLVLDPVQWSHAGRYAALISNRHGALTTTNVSLEVTPLAVWGTAGLTTDTNVSAGLSNVVRIAAGLTHTLALRRDGTISAWGRHDYSQTPVQVPPGLANAVGVAAGSSLSLALRADGTVLGFSTLPLPGSNIVEQLRDVVGLSIQQNHGLALHANGAITEWSAWQTNTLPVPEELGPAVRVAAGEGHALALRPDGTLVAWGANGNGQTDVPAGLSNVISIAAGPAHSLALRSDGTCVAWGGNGAGQTAVPSGLSNVVDISAGGVNSLALLANGSVVVWGEPGYGLTNPPPDLRGVTAIAGGHYFNAALVGDGLPWFPTASVRYAAVAGFPAFLRVDVAGALPMTYQWRKGNTDIPGATQAVLSLQNLRMDQAGSYRLIARNAQGSTLSPPIELAVLPLRFHTQPRSLTVAGSEKAVLAASVDGVGPFVCQWLRDGVVVPGQNALTLEIPAATWMDTGRYQVVVNNASGSARSAEAELRVIPIRTWGLGEVGNCAPGDLTSARGVAAGGMGAVALRDDGTVRIWDSRGSYGWMTNVPAGTGPIVGVAAGSYHILALAASGSVVGWGHPFYAGSQTVPPTNLTDAVAISAGGDHSMALRADGSLVLWGNNYYGQSAAAAWLDHCIAIADGAYHSVALREDGRVECWGLNDSGQSAPPPDLDDAIAIAAGSNHSLAVRSDGRVVGWGYNGTGQATPPPGLSNVVAVAAGNYHSMALRDDGSVVVWGRVGDWVTNLPAWGGSGFAAVAAYGDIGVAMEGTGAPTFAPSVRARRGLQGATTRFFLPATGGRPITYQWQRNGADIPGATRSLLTLSNLVPSQSGRYRLVARNPWGTATSTEIDFTVDAIRVVYAPQPLRTSLSSPATFSVTAEGQEPLSYQWLFNGQPLPGRTNAALTIETTDWASEGAYSVRVTNPYATVTSASATLELAPLVALLDNPTFQQTLPRGLKGIVGFAFGNYQGTGLAVKSDGTVLAWGDNSYGRTNIPAGLNHVIAVDANYSHCLALRDDGTVVAWGGNEGGQLNVPSGLNGVIAIAAGAYHSLALRSDGTVVAWGGGGGNQVQVPPGLSNVVAIAAGSFSLALKADGTMVAWGTYWNGFGNPPMDIPEGLNDVVSIGAGSGTALAVRSSGRVTAWGASWYNQTTVPEELVDAVAVAGDYTGSLALRSDGTLMGWGNALFGPILATGVTNIGAIDGGMLTGLVGDGSPVLPRAVRQLSGIGGSTVHLNLPAVGKRPMTCQWFRNGTAMPGATNMLLSLRGFSPDQRGVYTLRVTNALGAATSESITVSLDGVWLGVDRSTSSSEFRLGVFGPAGSRYALQASTDLVGWAELRRLTNNGTVQVFGDPRAGRTKRFYRLNGY